MQYSNVSTIAATEPSRVYTQLVATESPRVHTQAAVYNHWTGLVDWTGGLDWWTGTKSHFYAFQ